MLKYYVVFSYPDGGMDTSDLVATVAEVEALEQQLIARGCISYGYDYDEREPVHLNESELFADFPF